MKFHIGVYRRFVALVIDKRSVDLFKANIKILRDFGAAVIELHCRHDVGDADARAFYTGASSADSRLSRDTRRHNLVHVQLPSELYTGHVYQSITLRDGYNNKLHTLASHALNVHQAPMTEGAVVKIGVKPAIRRQRIMRARLDDERFEVGVRQRDDYY